MVHTKIYYPGYSSDVETNKVYNPLAPTGNTKIAGVNNEKNQEDSTGNGKMLPKDNF